MTAITSYQRRQNDRLRFWGDYEEFAKAESFLRDEKTVRLLYRTERRANQKCPRLGARCSCRLLGALM